MSTDLIYEKVDPRAYTKRFNVIVKSVTINDPENSVAKPIGSSTFKIQKYFSDIDINDEIHLSNVSPTVFSKIIASKIQEVVRNIKKYPLTFFSDFKCGIDPDTKEPFHWTESELVRGYIIRNRRTFTLQNLLLTKSIVKLDVISYYEGRFIEASSFFILSLDGHNINVNDDFMDEFITHAAADGLHFFKEKPFKTVKRIWSIARILQDTKTLTTLKDLILSDVSLLSQINSDCETMILLIEKQPHAIGYITQEYLTALDNLKYKVGIDNVLSQEEQSDLVNAFETVINDFRFHNYKSFFEMMNDIHLSLNEIIKHLTLSYIKKVQFDPVKYLYSIQ